MIPGFPSGNTHISFQMVDSPFHNASDFVKSNPFIRVPLKSGKHAKIHVLISISGASLFGGAARVFTVAAPLPFYHMDFGADPFIPVRTAGFMTMPRIFHIQTAVFRTGGVAVNFVTDLIKSTFVSWIIGNEDFGKMKIIF